MVLTGQRITGFTYDVATEKHRCLWDPLDLETPKRTMAIMKRLQGLQDPPLTHCEFIQGRIATEEELKYVHTEDLVEAVKNTCQQGPGEHYINYKNFSEKFDCVYVNGDSFEIAKLAAGSAMELVDAVHAGRVDNGMAIIRPPGHHASAGESTGFCLFNNVSIAAKHLIKNRGVQRLLIVDYDVHHGQGTQRAFYDDDRVMYFSIHHYDEGKIYPYLRESNFNHIGSGKGAGYNINVPLNKEGLSDSEYMAIFQQVLLPIAYQYNPEMILVSAGYDAAVGDPEGRMALAPAVYGHLVHALTNLAGGKVAVVLEGGYCLEALAEGAACTLEALLGYPCQPIQSIAAPDAIVIESILNAISVLRLYWSCLDFQERAASVKTSSKKEDHASLSQHFPLVKFTQQSVPAEKHAYFYSPFYSCAETVKLRHKNMHLREHYELFRKRRGTIKYRTCYAFEKLSDLEYGVGELAGNLGPKCPKDVASIHFQGSDVLSECVHVQGHQDQEAIMRSADSLLAVVDAVASGEALNGFAIIRPKGHPAKCNGPNGTCNAHDMMTVAKHAVKTCYLKKVLIIDWSADHFENLHDGDCEDPSILRILFNAGKETNGESNGHGKTNCVTDIKNAAGSHVCIPWQQQDANDGDYLTAFLQVVMPIAYEFAPELVLVSFEFYVGGKVTIAAYSTLARMLMSLAGGKLVVAVEGDCNSQMLDNCSSGILKALLGYPAEVLPKSLSPSPAAVRDIKAALDLLISPSQLWHCLQYRVILHDPTEEKNTHKASNMVKTDTSIKA